MHGDNPKRRLKKGDGLSLEVKEIFPTIQAEGPLAGTPAVFVRLGGCNLACDFCDTEFEGFKEQPLAAILAEVKRLSENKEGKRIRQLVVITGGEPLRQPIEKLCQQLLKAKFGVQVETNGTIFRKLPKEVSIICSPKNTGRGYHALKTPLLECLTALKFVVSKSHPLYGEVAEVGQKEFGIPVYVQPMDEWDAKKNEVNLQHARSIAVENGYHLSIQMHKLMGLP
jgi:7-carboxy-7-deazaguanine synthase